MIINYFLERHIYYPTKFDHNVISNILCGNKILIDVSVTTRTFPALLSYNPDSEYDSGLTINNLKLCYDMIGFYFMFNRLYYGLIPVMNFELSDVDLEELKILCNAK